MFFFFSCLSTSKLVFPNKRPKTSSRTRGLYINYIALHLLVLRFAFSFETRPIRVGFRSVLAYHGPRLHLIVFAIHADIGQRVRYLRRGPVDAEVQSRWMHFLWLIRLPFLLLHYEYYQIILRTGSTVFTYRVYSEHSPIPELSHPPFSRHFIEQ